MRDGRHSARRPVQVSSSSPPVSPQHRGGPFYFLRPSLSPLYPSPHQKSCPCQSEAIPPCTSFAPWHHQRIKNEQTQHRLTVGREGAMRNGKLLVRPRLHLIAASCVAGILLAGPIPTDGQGPKTARQAGATGPSPTVKAGQRTGQVSAHPPCLCARTQSSVKRASVDTIGSFRHPLGAGRDGPG